MRYPPIAHLLLVAAIATLAALPDALAHGVHGPASQSDGPVYVPPADATWWDAIYGGIAHNIAAMVKSARAGLEIGPVLSVLLLAFGYGVLHAVGPGHGKLLLASYMAATRAPVPIGIAIALAAAAVQATIAIAVVLVVALGLQGVANAVPALQGAVNVVSLLLLAALGLAIVLRQLLALDLLPQPVARAVPTSTCVCCGHSDHTAHGHRGHHPHDTHHYRDNDAHADHGSTHHAEGETVSKLGIAGVALSMGARPCTSAFAILLLALANNLLWLGIVATLAMAVGVACTLVLVAVFSVDLRDYAHTVLQRSALPSTALNVVTLIAGALLASVSCVGLVQAAT
ncbi:MAG: hypothetical protein AAFQ45_01440 [Pseudomonadota bacterium]